VSLVPAKRVEKVGAATASTVEETTTETPTHAESSDASARASADTDADEADEHPHDRHGVVEVRPNTGKTATAGATHPSDVEATPDKAGPDKATPGAGESDGVSGKSRSQSAGDSSDAAA
jgi:hypothetical protein